jgi:hypothetical protein
MEAPESVVIGLRNIRENLHLRWNPTAVRVKPGHIDASGAVIQAEFDPRFELWDKVDGQPEYKVMTLQHEDGSFRAPGQWLVDLINMVNPERWDGDVNKMLAHFQDRPEQLREEVAEKDFDDFTEMVARWAGWVTTPKSRVLTNHCEPLRRIPA